MPVFSASLADFYREILSRAKSLAKKHHDRASLSNAIFGPETGLLVKSFADAKERKSFTKSAEYRELQKLIESKPEPTANEGPLPTVSGTFNLRLPKSLHEALQREAKIEGVSLNQLCVSKLSGALGRILSRQAS